MKRATHARWLALAVMLAACAGRAKTPRTTAVEMPPPAVNNPGPSAFGPISPAWYEPEYTAPLPERPQISLGPRDEEFMTPEPLEKRDTVVKTFKPREQIRYVEKQPRR